jgi:hypothetical protein
MPCRTYPGAKVGIFIYIPKHARHDFDEKALKISTASSSCFPENPEEIARDGASIGHSRNPHPACS